MTGAGNGDAFLSVLKAGTGVGVSAGLTQHSSAEAKLALFRSLFRGREDVYPLRFESRKTGRGTTS